VFGPSARQGPPTSTAEHARSPILRVEFLAQRLDILVEALLAEHAVERVVEWVTRRLQVLVRDEQGLLIVAAFALAMSR
jgi:hypothetical protein